MNILEIFKVFVGKSNVNSCLHTVVYGSYISLFHWRIQMRIKQFFSQKKSVLKMGFYFDLWYVQQYRQWNSDTYVGRGRSSSISIRSTYEQWNMLHVTSIQINSIRCVCLVEIKHTKLYTYWNYTYRCPDEWIKPTNISDLSTAGPKDDHRNSEIFDPLLNFQITDQGALQHACMLHEIAYGRI